MYARTIDLADADDPVKLASGDRLPQGWYMLRAAFNPADTKEYGGVIVYLAHSGVTTKSSDRVALNPTESQVINVDRPTEMLVARQEARKCRLVITEV